MEEDSSTKKQQQGRSAPLCVGSYRRREGSSGEVDASTKKQQQGRGNDFTWLHARNVEEVGSYRRTEGCSVEEDTSTTKRQQGRGAPLCVGLYRRREGSSVEVDTSTKKQQQGRGNDFTWLHARNVEEVGSYRQSCPETPRQDMSMYSQVGLHSMTFPSPAR